MFRRGNPFCPRAGGNFFHTQGEPSARRAFPILAFTCSHSTKLVEILSLRKLNSINMCVKDWIAVLRANKLTCSIAGATFDSACTHRPPEGEIDFGTNIVVEFFWGHIVNIRDGLVVAFHVVLVKFVLWGNSLWVDLLQFLRS